MHEQDDPPAGGRQPDDVFAELRDRPTAGLDSSALWRRIEARLTPRSSAPRTLWMFGGGGLAPVMRLAYGGAAIAVIVMVAWAAVSLMTAPAGASQLVMLTPEEPVGAGVPEPGGDVGASVTGGPMRLDVRLIRGYDGMPPADVTAAAALGVGGADALRDARGTIENLLPFASYGIVGAWQGTVIPGEAFDIELADEYRLVVGSADTGSGDGAVLRLNAVELAGAGQDSAAADLRLSPGRLYMLGVRAPGAEDPDLVLLIRAEHGEQER